MYVGITTDAHAVVLRSGEYPPMVRRSNRPFVIQRMSCLFNTLLSFTPFPRLSLDDNLLFARYEKKNCVYHRATAPGAGWGCVVVSAGRIAPRVRGTVASAVLGMQPSTPWTVKPVCMSCYGGPLLFIFFAGSGGRGQKMKFRRGVEWNTRFASVPPLPPFPPWQYGGRENKTDPNRSGGSFRASRRTRAILRAHPLDRNRGNPCRRNTPCYM
ncbi:hypothetical protein F5B17DRAFT_377202 [Nemania serpens]|nr:hypothetical protein F5B17DRAFT_377202 [Nemania serpens]